MEILRLPGIIDPHVHLREPGATHKEDIASGTLAALAGGVVAVCDMPNNRPPTVERASWEDKLARLRASAQVDYDAFLGWVGGSLEPLTELGPQTVGLKLYLDETFGHLIVDRSRLAGVFAAWPGPGPIAIHAESASIRVALGLARATGARLHICHVPHPDDLLAIEEARQSGVRVTCEITPHHLFLSTADLPRLGPYGQMKPPLVSPEVVAQFWQRLAWVDCLGSDHAPHTRAEKDGPQPPPGVPGLETTLPLLLGAVGQGRLTLERAIELTHTAPLAIYGRRAPEETEVEVTWGAPYALPAEGYRTKCGWSPFAGCLAQGRVATVRLRGRTAWADGRALVEPGYGRLLERESAALS